ncbi:hypothetical protein AMTR_s00095p00032720 [Amborella trichopoda]|uniref:C2H2-type domain-containing protein n=1 Tax=Amborella trichopoda TaxID=13333 RepID=W1NRE3_AMBTC|nr:hypothetical protein AMTR_s00095p00032720 [Amborella trichopoda]
MDHSEEIPLHVSSLVHCESNGEFNAMALSDDLSYIMPGSSAAIDFCNLGFGYNGGFQVSPLPMACNSASYFEDLDFLETHLDIKANSGNEVETQETLSGNGNVSCNGLPDIFHGSSKKPQIKKGHENMDKLSKKDWVFGDDHNGYNIATVSVDLIRNRRPFKCLHSGCDKTFKNPQTLKMHHKTHYSDEVIASQLSSKLTSQASKAGQNKKVPCRCPICGRAFVGLYELRRHFGRKHSEGEKMHNCKKCGKKFYIEVDLRDHEKLCGEPVECKCGMKFAFKCNLLAHKRTHPDCLEPSVREEAGSGLVMASSNIAALGMKVEELCGIASGHFRTNILTNGTYMN